MSALHILIHFKSFVSIQWQNCLKLPCPNIYGPVCMFILLKLLMGSPSFQNILKLTDPGSDSTLNLEKAIKAIREVIQCHLQLNWTGEWAAYRKRERSLWSLCALLRYWQSVTMGSEKWDTLRSWCAWLRWLILAKLRWHWLSSHWDAQQSLFCHKADRWQIVATLPPSRQSHW